MIRSHFVCLGFLGVAGLGAIAACGVENGEVDEVSLDARAASRPPKPRLLGPIAAGDQKEGQLAGSTPDGYSFVLAHTRALTFVAERTSGTTFEPVLRVFGPLSGALPARLMPMTVPVEPLFEARSTAGNGYAEVRDIVLPAPGTYLAAVTCPNKSCRGKKYRLAAAWGNTPNVVARLAFRGTSTEGRESISGAIERGKAVEVSYDAIRYQLNLDNYNEDDPPCRMFPTMFYRQRSGASFESYVLEAAGSGRYARDSLSAIVPVRADAEFLEIYFMASQAGRSCFNPNPQVWDSNYGRNFVFRIADAVLRFGGDGLAPSLAGELRGGGVVAITYDVPRMWRLMGCRPAYSGFNLVEITAYYRFSGWTDFASVTMARPPRAGAPEIGGTTLLISVPAGARELELFFNGRAECEAWDSNWGNNFHFAVK